MSRKGIDHINFFFEKGVYINGRIIHIQTDIDTNVAMDVIKALDLLEAASETLPISIYIATFGGCPYSAFGIYDYIKANVNAPVETCIIGTAMSAGSIIFMSGDTRTMLQNSVLMLHTVSSYAEGKVHTSLSNESDECKRIHQQMCKIYARHSKKDYKYWTSHIKYEDRYYRGKEALRLGLATDFIEDDDE